MRFRSQQPKATAGKIVTMFGITLGLIVAACSGPPQQPQQPAPGASSGSAQVPDGEALFRGIFFGQGEVAAQLPELWSDYARREAIELANRSEGSRQDMAASLDRLADHMQAIGAATDSVSRVRKQADTVRRGQGPVLSDRAAARLAGLNPADYTQTASAAIIEYIRGTQPSFFAEFQSAIQSGNPLQAERVLDLARNQIMDATVHLKAEGQMTTNLPLLAGEITDANSDNVTDGLGAGDGDGYALGFVALALFLVAIVSVFIGPGSGQSTQLAHEQFVNLISTRFSHS